MFNVLVLMSVYNGNKKIIKQVSSILIQKGVDTHILIRDDGSNEETASVLKVLQQKHPDRIDIIWGGNNVGWKKSFIQLLCDANLDYDYYAFSDQDDIWFEKKLLDCLNVMEEENSQCVKLAHCNACSVDENLQPRNEQEMRTPVPPDYKMALATEYFQGCGMVWNNDAMRLIKRYKPEDSNIAHDYWVGLLCYLFGKVYFVEKKEFYHIRYGNNSSADGNVKKGRFNRFVCLLKGESVYMNPSADILKGYGDLLDEEKKRFLLRLSNCKTNMMNRIKIALDMHFRRPSWVSTLLLKVCILMGKY